MAHKVVSIKETEMERTKIYIYRARDVELELNKYLHHIEKILAQNARTRIWNKRFANSALVAHISVDRVEKTFANKIYSFLCIYKCVVCIRLIIINV